MEIQQVITFFTIVFVQTSASQYIPPSIIEPGSKLTEYILPKSSLSLKCTARGNPTPRYEWTLNGQVLSSDSVYQVDKDNGGLTILSFEEEQEGEYQCLAAIRVTDYVSPVAVSPVITLLAVKLGNRWIQTDPELITRKEGDYASLKCENVPESVPKAKFSWFLESQDGKKQQVSEDFRRYVDVEGTLHFMYLEPVDQQQIMQYKCAVYNSLLDTIKLGSPKDLRVTRVPTKPQVKPVAQYHTNSARFLRHETGVLECVFSGFPQVTVTWLDGHGNEITNTNKYEIVASKQGRMLRIKDLIEENEGDYTCRGVNAAGRTEAIVNLDVTSGPVWESGLSYLVKREGDTAEFTCDARPAHNENPLDPPIWYKNGLEMSGSQSGKLEFSNRRRILRVVNLRKPNDIMCVQCKVSNDVGFEFDNACLNVINPITVVNPAPSVQTLIKGDQANLTVVGTSDRAFPLLRKWHFKNKTYELSPPPHVLFDETSQRAYINTTQLSENEFSSIEGFYYIELYNVYDAYTYSIQLIISRPIVEPPVAEGGFPWWVIIIVVLLLLIAIIIIIVCCCCRNKDKGAYKVYKTETQTTYLHPDEDLDKDKFHAMTQLIVPEDRYEPQKKVTLAPHYDVDVDEDSLDGYGGGVTSTA